MLSFPEDFLWGAATSSYQIEGATKADGRGESVWDRFCQTPHKIDDGSSGDGACDHYHRYREDIALMGRLGLGGYRFSISWPRIMPVGRGRVNEPGLDFYDRLVDALLEADIEPYATLYHWDHPQALEDEGGWCVRSTAEAFADYAAVVARRLGDRVENWMTLNEPQCVSTLGYLEGLHAPGRQSPRAALQAAHHLLLGHGWAVPAVRAHAHHADVGIALNLSPAVPASPSDYDREACRHFDGSYNRWFLEPLHRGCYPPDIVQDYLERGSLGAGGMDFVRPGDLKAIRVPTDFLGVNYYTRKIVRSKAVPEAKNAERTVREAPRQQWTEMGWEVHPEGLADTLRRVHLDYRPPKIYVTENGASYSTPGPDATGRVRDEQRVAFLREHLAVAHEVIGEGIPLQGYFVWSLLDNFEWHRGYGQRFGITWVDFETQARIPKDSARWYGEVIAHNRVI